MTESATKGSPMKRGQTFRSIVGLHIVVLAVLVGALIVRWIWFPGQAFDPIAWQDEALVQQGARLAMADRLVARRSLTGKSRDEVVKLLGEPPPTEYFADWDLVYWLGRERGFMSIDSEWLVIKFGPDGRVADYRIVRD